VMGIRRRVWRNLVVKPSSTYKLLSDAKDIHRIICMQTSRYGDQLLLRLEFKDRVVDLWPERIGIIEFLSRGEDARLIICDDNSHHYGYVIDNLIWRRGSVSLSLVNLDKIPHILLYLEVTYGEG